jgi:hypothetical protein
MVIFGKLIAPHWLGNKYGVTSRLQISEHWVINVVLAYFHGQTVKRTFIVTFTSKEGGFHTILETNPLTLD